ncbi:hypothetical protein FACS1894216_15830 [Synergistales bacterium]|nr:hypothetical protein FACS1894216_15830 [Synergistales bacterium]
MIRTFWANTAAFFIAVTYAYFTNTLAVFRKRLTWRNFGEFYQMRIATLLLDDGGLMWLIHMGLGEMKAKIIVNVVIIIINYLCSKFYIFKKKEAAELKG